MPDSHATINSRIFGCPEVGSSSLVGWHWEFLPTFAAELASGVEDSSPCGDLAALFGQSEYGSLRSAADAVMLP